MKVILSHPTGNQNVRNLAKGLIDNKLLVKYFTTFGLCEDNIFNKLKIGPFAEIKRRSYSNDFKDYISTHPLMEISRLASIKLKIGKLYKEDSSIFSDARVFEDFDKHVASKLSGINFDAIYSYAGTSLHSFREAERLGKYKFYEQHGCYWKTAEFITNTEFIKNPDWKNTLPFLNISQKRKENVTEELILADEIFVASKFCKSTLPKELINKKINVIPYGFPKPLDNRIYRTNKKLKLLFVGNLTQLKGLSYLFEALESFTNYVELTIIGSLPNLNSPILLQNLKKHNYLGTRSHEKVLEIMQMNDVLIFPTLLDAFGMVISESMSQGTPVITTTSSGGPELINDKQDGWIIEPGQSESIKRTIEEILLNRGIIEEFGQKALIKANDRTWGSYQLDICSKILNRE